MTENLLKIEDLTPEQIASICDHTFLSRSGSYRTKGQSAVRLREEAFKKFLQGTVDMKYKPYSVCVRAEDVRKVKAYFEKTGTKGIKIASVVGFPDGSYYSTPYKLFETELAINDGACEIDMVLKLCQFKNNVIDHVTRDIKAVVKAAHKRNAIVKVILETAELNLDEIKRCCELCEECNADFVKTSTGFSMYGARAEDLKVMRANFSKGVKMSGGVNANNVKELLEAASGRTDGLIDLNPLKIRIGEGSMLGGDGY
ncbi:MAG: deoxyribose-phosphate aldolase [archaeon]